MDVLNRAIRKIGVSTYLGLFYVYIWILIEDKGEVFGSVFKANNKTKNQIYGLLSGRAINAAEKSTNLKLRRESRSDLHFNTL